MSDVENIAEIIEPEVDELERIVVFHVGGQRYAFPIGSVREIQQIVELTDIPEGMPGVVGMINLRGLVVPVLDLRMVIGLEPVPYRLETPMIICIAHQRLAAVIVDEVEDVIDLGSMALQDPPQLHPLASMMLGIVDCDGLVHVLDADLLLTPRLEAVE